MPELEEQESQQFTEENRYSFHIQAGGLYYIICKIRWSVKGKGGKVRHVGKGKKEGKNKMKIGAKYWNQC